MLVTGRMESVAGPSDDLLMRVANDGRLIGKATGDRADDSAISISKVAFFKRHCSASDMQYTEHAEKMTKKSGHCCLIEQFRLKRGWAAVCQSVAERKRTSPNPQTERSL
jgi:hypothetical protein